MDFDLSDEQRLLQDSANRYVQQQCGFDQWLRRKHEGQQPGRMLWPAFADMGWLALPFSAVDGGLDGGPLETMLLMEALGRGLVAEPYLQGVVQAGEVLKRCETGPARSARIEAVAQGRLHVAMACDERPSRYDRRLVQTTAEPIRDGWRLRGDKTVVLGAAAADAFIVSARTSAGHTLFWVDASAPGLSRKDYPLVDGGQGADLRLEQVMVGDDCRLGRLGGADELLGPATDAALAAMGAEAVGLVDLLLAQTLAYTQQRRQFGQHLSQFQALRHRMVDMFMQVEQLRSIVILATVRLAEQHADLPRSLSALKVQVGKVGRFVSQQAVQLHGGMGMTDEIVVGHAFKRLLSLDAQLGNVDHHLTRFAALSA
ncbi:MAG: acyl-CoA dehydrogenase family protein [Rubrivivax sp.]|jgi:alkylation response protein AidB-like acyl-CoA dehydrogenase